VSLALVLAVFSAALPSQYVFPPAQQVFPEGISLRPGSDTFYVSSTANGAIYRGTLDKPQLKVFLAPGANGRAVATGVRASRHHLVVAGSVTGYIFVYDLPSGRFVRRFATGSGGLMNDVAIAPNGDVYATDSNRGLVFRIPAKALSKRTSATKRLNPFVSVKDTPIGVYANGIVSAGKRYLLVVGLVSGVVGRIDLQTKRVKAVKGFSLPLGDGLARSGRTLYAVNTASRVTQVSLSRDWLHGTVVRQITSPTFHLPTTMQILANRLLVVNSQFDKRGLQPELPFTVSSIRRPGPKQAARPAAQGSP
jgi:sugar lactone lactonase YvrE